MSIHIRKQQRCRGESGAEVNERSQDGDLSTARGILLRVTGGWGVGGGGDCLEINIIQSFHKKRKKYGANFA